MVSKVLDMKAIFALIVLAIAVGVGMWPVHSWWILASLCGGSTFSGNFKFPPALERVLHNSRPAISSDPHPVVTIPPINESSEWHELLKQVEHDGKPRIIRGALTTNTLKQFETEYWVKHFGSHPVKQLYKTSAKQYSVIPGVPLTKALSSTEAPYLLQGLNVHNSEWTTTVKLPLDGGSWDHMANNTALTFNKVWDYHFHSHPDTTVNFCLSGKKHWVFIEPKHFLHFHPAISTISALSSPNSIKGGGPASWESLPRWEVHSEPGDILVFGPWTFHAVESDSNDDKETVSFLWSPMRLTSAIRASPLVTGIFFLRLAANIPLSHWVEILGSWAKGKEFSQAFAAKVYAEQGDAFGDEA